MTNTNFILKFGKYKGQMFLDTPKSYQDWLLAQDWFKPPVQLANENLVSAMKSYSMASENMVRTNYSSRSIDAMFDAEKILDDAVESDRKYFGMNFETKQAQLDWEYAEIVACNAIDDLYND